MTEQADSKYEPGKKVKYSFDGKCWYIAMYVKACHDRYHLVAPIVADTEFQLNFYNNILTLRAKYIKKLHED